MVVAINKNNLSYVHKRIQLYIYFKQCIVRKVGLLGFPLVDTK